MSDEEVRLLAEGIVQELKDSAEKEGYEFDPLDKINATLMEQTRINEAVIKILTNTN